MASSHLKALVRKNVILWKRNCLCSILEILVPILMVLLFKIFRDNSPPEDIPEISYYNSPLTLQPDDSVATTLMKQCAAGVNDDSGGVIGLVPSGDPLIATLDGYFTGKKFCEFLKLNRPWLSNKIF